MPAVRTANGRPYIPAGGWNNEYKKQKPQAMPAASLKRGKMKKRKNQSVYFYLTGKM